MVGTLRRNFLRDSALILRGLGAYEDLKSLFSYTIAPKKADGLENLIVIGCSCGGKEAVEYLVPKLNIELSTVVIVPHIECKQIYDSLNNLDVNTVGVGDGVEIKPGSVYVVGHEDWSNLRFKKKIGLRDGHFYLWRYLVSPDVDNVMKLFAKSYYNRCIAVILSGCEATTGTRTDGSHGVKHIKRHRGRVLVQIEETDTEGRYELGYYHSGMPRFALKATKCDFAGPLPELVKELNSYLNKNTNK